LYATDAHILVKQNMKVHGFEDEEIAIINDCFIHKNAFAEILRYDVVHITENGFECTKDNVTATIKYVKKDEVSWTYPKADAIIPDEKDKKRITIDEIGLNIKLLTKLEQCL